MAFPIDIQFVKRAEANLGRTLPLGDVGKMRRHNGGDPLLILADLDTDRYADAVRWRDHETGDLNNVTDTFEQLSGAGR